MTRITINIQDTDTLSGPFDIARAALERAGLRVLPGGSSITVADRRGARRTIDRNAAYALAVAGHTQAEIAEKLGASASGVSRALKGGAK